MDRVECVVVGVGVVGLAVARALFPAGSEVVVIEREGLIGSGTNSRNPEMINAGIYYPRDSAKARLCLRRREMLYTYCASRGLPHRWFTDLPEGVLVPGYTGIRPKLHPIGGLATDFAIEGPAVHGLSGLVNLFGIESPGLTASRAIAECVLEQAGSATDAS